MLTGGVGVTVARGDISPWVSADADLARHVTLMAGGTHMGADPVSGMMGGAGMMRGAGMMDGPPAHEGHHPNGSSTPTSGVAR